MLTVRWIFIFCFALLWTNSDCAPGGFFRRIHRMIQDYAEKQLEKLYLSSTVYTDYYDGGHVLAGVIRNETGEIIDCYLVGHVTYVRFLLREDLHLIPEVLAEMPRLNYSFPVVRLTQKRMADYIDACTIIGEHQNTSHAVELGSVASLSKVFGSMSQFLFIFPGTKWCGAGNVARDYNDLGQLEATDRCCREHDSSHDNIPAGETKHGLLNPLMYTMYDTL